MAAALSFESAFRHVKRGQLESVYYLTGDEDVLKDELVRAIIEHAVDTSSRDFNVDVRAAGDLDGEAVHALVETPPMLAERRVVVIKNVDQWRKNAKVWRVVEQYVQRPSPTTVLVLTHSAGEKPHTKIAAASTHVDVAPLSPAHTRSWLAASAKRNQLVLTPEAIDLLVDALGDNLSLLATEVAKLAGLADGDRPLSPEQVAPLIGVRYGETPHDWVAAVLERDQMRAARMIPPLLGSAGVTGVRLVGMLGTALVGLRVAAAALAEGQDPRRAERTVFGAIQSARPFGLRSWSEEARAWVRAARQWRVPEVDQAIATALEADRALKSTTVSDDEGILTSMVLSMARAQAA